MQNHRLLLKSDAINIYYNFADEWIYAEWIGESTLEGTQFGIENMLKFIKQERCSKLLSDQRKRTGIWSDAIDWIHKDIMPQAEDAGLRASAIVYSEEHFSKLSAKFSIDWYRGKVAVLAFNNIETAENWLRYLSGF